MSSLDIAQILTGDPLTDTLTIAIGEDDSAKGYVADKLCPVVKKPKKKASVPVMGFSDDIKNTAPRQDDQPAPSTLKIGLQQVSYECISLDERVFFSTTEENDSDQANGLLLKQGVIRSLANKIKLKKEKLVFDKLSVAANYKSGHSETLSGTDQLNHASATPVKMILNRANVLRKKMGVMADSIFFTNDSWDAFINAAAVQSLLPSIKHQTITEDDILPLLRTGALKHLSNIIVGGPVYNSTPTKATRTGADLWSDDIIIFKKANVDKSAGLVEMGAFFGVEVDNPIHYGAREKEPANDEKGVWLENRYAYDPVIMAADNTVNFAILLKDTVA